MGLSEAVTERWRRVDAVLADALDRDAEARPAFLRSACGHDTRLMEEVLALLARAEDAARVLGESAAAFAAPLLAEEDSVDLRPGQRIGAYRIEEERGRGGMGVVYRATRGDGVYEKSVALKLVKRGMDTEEVLARFRRERRLLATLDHPGIARLLDGGMAPDGRPYLVMEYVDGDRITTYCDRARLDIDARLRLFERVCEAVQHAHRRSVIHRDLKPDNILIRGDGGEPLPKLLDFGIARLFRPDADETLTQAGTTRLTPAYAAPEQLEGEPITKAADIYTLGVVLHELLVGCRPRPDPPPPSSVVTDGAARARATLPRALRRRLDGDLDAIMLTALRQDPEERYPEVEHFLHDLRRHRRGLPVLAQRKGWAYRAGKFLRRHRLRAAAAAGLAVLMTTTGAFYAHRIQQEQRGARRGAERTQLMAGIIRDLFQTADPYTLGTRRGDSLLLVRGLRTVEHDLSDEPDLQVELLTTLGRIYRERGRYDQARPLLARALSIARATHVAPHSAVIDALRELGDLESELRAYPQARRFYSEMLAMQRGLYGEHERPILVSLGLLAQIEALAGRTANAERMHRDVVALSRRIHSPTDSAHILSLWKLSRTLYMSGKYAESESTLREVLRLRRLRFGDNHPAVAQAIQWLGLVLTDRGEFETSERHLRQALAMQRRLLGAEHDDVAVSLFGLGLLAAERGVYGEAVRRIGQSVEMSRRVLGEEHASTLFRQQTLGEVYRAAGDYPRALQALEPVVDVYRRTRGDSHEGVGAALAIQGRVLSDAGHYAAAEPVLREAVSILASPGSPSGRAQQEARVSYGELLTRTGRAETAEPILRSAARALVARTAARHDRSVLHAKAALAANLRAQGRSMDAEPILREIWEICNDHYGSDHPRTRGARQALVEARPRPPPG